jgi:beta-barrel assembly-enhancing protease
LILAADNEAELAGVISHEIAHVAACHAAQEMEREELTNVASMPLIFRLVFRRAIRNTISLKPTRSFEFEADFLGIEYLYKAGYDPQALLSFFEKVRARENQNRSRRANALDVHPQIADRIERTQQEINTLLPPASEYKLDTSEFQEIKKRLAELDNGHKLNKKPTEMVLP